MPNRPIDFKFTADVVRLLNGLDKAELSVEDLEQAFVEASNSSEDLEKKIGKATREAEKDVEKLERAVRDIPKATDDMADEAVKDFDRIGEEAKETGREAGQNFAASMGEGLSSGDTSEVIQEVLGEAVGSMSGPVGAAVGVLAGGALLIFNNIKKAWEETQQAIAEQTESMWSTTMASIKGKIGEVGAEITSTMLVQEELARLWQDSPDDLRELVEQAKLLKINTNDVVLARAGDKNAIDRVNAALRQSEQSTENYLGMTADTIQAHEGLNEAINRGGTSLDTNTAKLKAYSDSLPAAAQVIQDMTDNIAAWQPGVQKTQAQIDLLYRAYKENPLNLDVRLNMDASQLRQLAPYGTLATTPYNPATWKNPYGSKPRAG
jgi:chromosome segregation ATPase